MLRTERHEKILNLLQDHGVVRTIELSEEFSTSRQTIHNDIDHLDKLGKLTKVHGGAVLSNMAFESDAKVRQEQNIQEKRAIGRLAASYVNDGETIFIDTGTTIPEMIPYLKNVKDLTVITNSLIVAWSLLDYEEIKVTILGGEVNAKERSTAGNDAFQNSLQYFVDKSFISVSGFDIQAGYTDYFHNESAIRKNMIKQSSTSFALFDHTKVGLVATTKFADLTDIDVIITDDKVPTDLMDSLSQLKQKYLIARGN